jgi:hypothetical protein
MNYTVVNYNVHECSSQRRSWVQPREIAMQIIDKCKYMVSYVLMQPQNIRVYVKWKWVILPYMNTTTDDCNVGIFESVTEN